jgi:hypothetical protein
MKTSFFLIVCFLLLPCVLAEVEITEIMFNPFDSNEWIEFFNSGEELNISGLEIADNYQTDEITCCESDCLLTVSNESYFLILEEGTTLNVSGKQVFCVDDASIGNGLGNNGDEIYLFRANATFLGFIYNISADKGYSLARINETWMQSFPSPGETNQGTNIPIEEPTEETIEVIPTDKQVYTFVNYASLLQLHNLNYPDSSEQLNVSGHYNISYFTENITAILYDVTFNMSFKHTSQIEGNFSFETPGDYLFCTELFLLNTKQVSCGNLSVYDSKNKICNVSLALNIEKKVFEKNESIVFDHLLSNTTFEFEIEYWVEDLFGNEIKIKHMTDNLNEKQFSPDFDEQDKAYFIKSNLTKISCNNTGTKTFSETLVVVKGDMANKKNQSQINISELPEEVRFGDILNINLEIYKSDTRKTLVEAYVKGNEKISSVTGIKIYGKFSESEISLPILLKDNCDKRYPEGNYTLIIEGIDAYAEKQLYMKHNSECPLDNKKKTGFSTGSGSSAPSQSLQTKDKSYELLSLIQDVFLSEVISSIKINNPENKPHTYELWSYLYKGTVSYSGEREANKIKFTLEPFSEETITLRSKLLSDPPEQLMYKIKIQREDRKTPYEITENITIKKNTENNNTENGTEKLTELSKHGFYTQQENDDEQTEIQLSQNERQPDQQSQRITSNIIYQSKTEKLKGGLALFIISTIVFGAIAFLKLRPKNFFNY